jgi:hypothetical protein
MAKSVEQNTLKEELQKLTANIRELAEASKEDIFSVLLILQELESLHQNIRTEMFEPNLPDTRHRLYLLMKHLEEVGGWPYIERMRLRNICANLVETESSPDNQESIPSD